MSNEKPLDQLPEDVARALATERARADPPEVTQSALIARIEASDEFRVATGVKHVGSRDTVHPLAALRTRTGLLLFAAGTLWGAMLGGTVVALIKVPAPVAPVTAPSPDAGR